MRITLYLETKILEFELPKEISGSFSFDENPRSDSKLINIKSNNDKWYLYSTQDSKVLQNNDSATEIELKPNSFYNIKRFEKTYLIFISNTESNKISAYKFNTSTNIIFGGSEKCNIKYNIDFINREILSITAEDEKLFLSKLGEDNVYKNNKIMKIPKSEIIAGDRICTYGLNITFLKDMFLINNPNNLLAIKEREASIEIQIFKADQNNTNKEVIDRDLYNENEYFSKSPRIRRFIEKKDFKLDQPPRTNNGQDMPLLLTIGPMLTMGATSLMMLASTIMRINSGQGSLSNSWPQIVMSIAMLSSTLLWPNIIRAYNKRRQKKLKKEIIEKYNEYLSKKEQELIKERDLQRDILIENLITLQECGNIISTRGVLFWNKRNDENDFLTVRVGIGKARLQMGIKYPEDGFTIEEDELKKAADNLIEKYKYIENVPIGYSLYENVITAIMGPEEKSYNFVNNMILQLLTFYNYEDIKLMFFTTEENKFYFEYGKYLKHTFTNNTEFRFFASNQDSYQNLSSYINMEISNRQNSKQDPEKEPYKPHYIIIIDNYEDIKKFDFVNAIAESEENLGFSVIILENRLSKLPSKCNNFISLNGETSGILKNSFESQEQIIFKEEINYQIYMMNAARVLSNIPIEFEDGLKYLPESISFMEMEHVGRVEQLNILNRWRTNDPTISLKAEIGIDEFGNVLALDLHEKYHGPHGLIAGTTGSGKSEFIITYVLSMCMNYSPEYVSFILIDYKGGGLAYAFENKTQGIVLPHLAGTITNLDKADMDRTLVSIDSETKRRQKIFNEARDKLGESTIDIYKYQAFYRDGKVSEPLPHLFIICDEFAELKAQQPDFMDNLISVARIGRSLGVHLILATQKPSGVVNDQIWSNSRFKVCLKVQTTADSKEMIQRPDAAYIKQAGRFFLQVGYDEYFSLGQSGWCGAKYYPADQIVKEVDKSVNFIDDCGNYIKSIQAGNKIKIAAKGEQLPAIMNEIINISKKENLRARKLWLDNIPEKIYIDELAKKYNITPTPYEVKAIIGEYDAPEIQEQGLVEYELLEDENTIIYGLDSEEREMLLSTIIYYTCLNYSPEELNYYILDYGSESLRKFSSFPHMGGMVFAGEDEELKNLIKLIRNEIKERKKIFANYSGEYKNYIKNSNEKLPLKVIIFNNYDSIYEANQDMYDYLPSLVRDSARYGIIFIFTANAINSVSNKIAQNFKNYYAFRLKDKLDYGTLFNSRKRIEPRDMLGRGIINNEGLHEFQTASIIKDESNINEHMIEITKFLKEKYKEIAEQIPTLPEKVTFDKVKRKLKDLSSIPIGISKDELEIIRYNFTENVGTIITSNKLEYTKYFIMSLIYEFQSIKNTNIIYIDGRNKNPEIKGLVKNYYNIEFDKVTDMLLKYYENIVKENKKQNEILFISGIEKYISSLTDKKIFENIIGLMKKTDNLKVIILDDVTKIKTLVYETWYTNTFSNSDAIWIGRGIMDQSLIKINYNKELNKAISLDYGINVKEGLGTIIKLIDFYEHRSDEEDE